MPPPDVRITAASADVLPRLRAVFLALHERHREIAPVAVTEPDERAWAARLETYERCFAEDRALLQVAAAGEQYVGYALTILHAGSDDTFPLGDGYAELYTLAVLPQRRGQGIGSALLDAVDLALSERGVSNLSVAVMCGNDPAIRLYRRRGLIPVELILCRVGDPPGRR